MTQPPAPRSPTLQGVLDTTRALLERAEARCANLEKERDTWKANAEHWRHNHDKRVSAARVLIERIDMPLERTRAYQDYLSVQRELDETYEHALKMGDTVSKVVNAIRGEPPPNCLHSTHDVVELVTEMRKLLNDTPFAARMEREWREFDERCKGFATNGDLPSEDA